MSATSVWPSSSSPTATKAEVRASLRGDDEDGGGYLIAPGDWLR